MHATDQHVEQWSAWDTGLSNMTDNPWTAAMDGSWTGPAADAGAERAQKLDVYMEKFGDAAKTMKTITEAQQAADERWAQAPSEADVRKAQALWLIAKNSDASNTAALEKEYLELKDKRESEEEAYKRACEDTQKSIEALELPDVPDDSSGTGEKPTDDDKDPKDPTDDDGSDDEEEDDGGLDGSGDDKPGSGEKGDDKPTDPTSPKPTDSPSSPNPSSSTKPDVTSPSTPNPSSSETPHIPVNASTNLSSDSSASNAPSSSTPKVFPSTQQSTAQPTMATAQPQQVMMTPAQSAPSSSTPASQQQPYRPSSPTPSHSTSTTQRDRTDDADPVGLIGSPVPVSHAVPVSHTAMPNSMGSSSGTSLSSANSGSSGAPTAAPAAGHGANPTPNAPSGGVGGVGSPLGAGSKTTTNTSGRTPAADQPNPDKTVPPENISGDAADEERRRAAEEAELTKRAMEIAARRAAWDKAQGAA